MADPDLTPEALKRLVERRRDKIDLHAVADRKWVDQAITAVSGLMAEQARLRDAIERIRLATVNGDVCDDVAWFSMIETLHDFCANTLDPGAIARSTSQGGEG